MRVNLWKVLCQIYFLLLTWKISWESVELVPVLRMKYFLMIHPYSASEIMDMPTAHDQAKRRMIRGALKM